jgi:hypothetical protein
MGSGSILKISRSKMRIGKRLAFDLLFYAGQEKVSPKGAMAQS